MEVRLSGWMETDGGISGGGESSGDPGVGHDEEAGVGALKLRHNQNLHRRP